MSGALLTIAAGFGAMVFRKQLAELVYRGDDEQYRGYTARIGFWVGATLVVVGFIGVISALVD
jgi:hypothetical protein